MAETGDFVTDLAIVMVVAAAALLVVRGLRQPLVLGYLVAGIVVGPFGYAPFQLVSPESVETLAQLGIIFIMMSLGLEFNPRKLRSIGAVAFVTSTIQILFSFAAGQYIAQQMGAARLESFFIGAAVAVSSTLVAVKVLEERGSLSRPHGKLAVGILLVEDIASIAFLAVAGGLAVRGSFAITDATSAILALTIFTLAALIVGVLVLPRFFHYAAKVSEELLLIVLLGAVLGISLLADHFGLSVALGAFIVGAVVAETRIVEKAHHIVAPLKHMFTAVFFVSVGMLIAPNQIIAEWRVIAAFSAVVVLTRLFVVPVPAFLFGTALATGSRAGASISQIGEFSFIIVSSGIAIGLVSDRWLAILAGVAAVTTLMTPYLISGVEPTLRMARRIAPAPLVTFAEVYVGWVDRLGDAEETRRHRLREIELLRRLLLNVVVLVALGGVAWIADRAIGQERLMLGESIFLVRWFLYPAVLLVALPFLLVVWRSLRELAVEVFLELVPDRLAQQGTNPLPLQIVRASLGFAVALGLGALTFALTPDLGDRGRPVLLLVVAIVGLAAAFLWHRIQGLHAHIETTVTNLFGTKSRSDMDRDEVLKLIGIHYSISLATETVKVEPHSRVAHHPIRSAQIRNRSGATIVCIDRGDERIVNPLPTTVLLPGDELLIMGERHHLKKARDLIESAPAHDTQVTVPLSEPVRVREITLSEASFGSGRSIVEIALRNRSGASLVAAIRGSDHIQNPAPGFTMAAGDRLFLFGTSSQLDRAEALLLTGDENPEGTLAKIREEVGTIAGLDLPDATPPREVELTPGATVELAADSIVPEPKKSDGDVS